MYATTKYILLLLLFPFVAQAIVPSSSTFKFVNEGEFGDYIVEYDASYRVLDIFTFPFTLCFYNTTPNAFTLALRMGSHRSESLMRWVWDANRGNPVKEKATLTFGTDGNLILANPDGKIVWQTGTANKGVVGLKLLPNGNMVLHDSKGGFVWQTFDHPTDTLLVAQSLRPKGPNKIVSRVSALDGSLGPYSFILEKNHLALYLKSKNSPKPLLYYRTDDIGIGGSISNVIFNSAPETEGSPAFEIVYGFSVVNSSNSGTLILSRPKYNSTLSLLRVGSDGTLKVYTYFDKVDWGAWEVTYSLFDRDEFGCKLPSKCGSMGICEDDMCVACPRPKGLLGWSKSTCAPPKLSSCGSAVNYYKVVGVEHFTSSYSNGDSPMKFNQCREKCTNDCRCLGFFYKEESSKCFLAPEIGTMMKVTDLSHVAYIKMPK